MEVFTAMVAKAVEQNLYQNLAGISPLQRVSIYADDVVMFLKLEPAELQATKVILKMFGEASGLKVNYRKTTATLIRGSAAEGETAATILGCDIAKFPIRYLGLQLALRPLTKAELQPLLDSVFRIVPAWQRGMMARTGRLILINAVISARAIHHLLVEDAPAWLLEEIIKWLRAFFWVGKQQVSGG
jgi:hypothetical protein